MTDNKKFWKTIKPFLSNKGLNSNKLMLREKDVVVADEKALATLINNYFVNITADSDLKRNSENFYYTPQARNQEFFRAEVVFQNKGTSINFLSTTQERKAPQGKISDIFFLDTLKTAF